MAFETVFKETSLDQAEATSLPEAQKYHGGVSLMAYDQRFANNETCLSQRSHITAFGVIPRGPVDEAVV